MRVIWDFLKYRLFLAALIFVFIFSPLAALYWFFWGTAWKCLLFSGIFAAGIAAGVVFHIKAQKKNAALFAAMLSERGNTALHSEEIPHEGKPESSPDDQKKRPLFRADVVISTVLVYGALLVLMAVMSAHQ